MLRNDFSGKIKVRILLHLSDRNAGWIIEKFAFRLKRQLEDLGYTVDCCSEISNGYDIIHFMSYAWAEKTSASCTSFSITHIDDKYKLKEIGQKLKILDVGICFSSHMEKYLRTELNCTNITYILPGHDEIIKRRKIRFLITSKVYKDGRKNEQWLYSAVKEVFDPEELAIHIHGSGWENVVSKLQKDNFEIIYHPGTNDYEADYQNILGDLDKADFYLYLGFDEGSMGTLDAKLAGVRCLVSNQGFHQDICDNNDYLFDDYSTFIKDLRNIKISFRLNPILESLTWQNYAEAHLKLWHEVLDASKHKHFSNLIIETHNNTFIQNHDNTYQKLKNTNDKSIRRLFQYLSRKPIFVKLRKRLRL